MFDISTAEMSPWQIIKAICSLFSFIQQILNPIKILLFYIKMWNILESSHVRLLPAPLTPLCSTPSGFRHLGQRDSSRGLSTSPSSRTDKASSARCSMSSMKRRELASGASWSSTRSERFSIWEVFLGLTQLVAGQSADRSPWAASRSRSCCSTSPTPSRPSRAASWRSGSRPSPGCWTDCGGGTSSCLRARPGRCCGAPAPAGGNNPGQTAPLVA